jgi:hypothetical protein
VRPESIHDRGAEVVDPTNICDPVSFPNTHARNRNDRILINDAWMIVLGPSIDEMHAKNSCNRFRSRARGSGARARDDSCMHA